MFGRQFFIGRFVGVMLLGFAMFFGLSMAYRAGQMRGYQAGVITGYQQAAPRGEESAPAAPFYGPGHGMYGGWGMRPHFGFGFLPFLCLIPLGFLFLGGFFFRRRWHHHHHGPMGGPWHKHPGKGQSHPFDEDKLDPDETVYKA